MIWRLTFHCKRLSTVIPFKESRINAASNSESTLRIMVLHHILVGSITLIVMYLDSKHQYNVDHNSIDGSSDVWRKVQSNETLCD